MESKESGYRIELDSNLDAHWSNKLLVATPVTGLVRIEWVQARYGQVIPVNWSQVQMLEYMDGYIPLRYQVDDAQNLITQKAIENNFEWLLLIEHDVLLPPDAFIKFNKYIREDTIPVVSGLYYTRSRPSEPLVFRGRGNSFYADWKLGDLVWADGVPTGCLLINCKVLKAIWNDSPEYKVGNSIVRRVFNTPRNLWFDPESNQFNTAQGTSDLEWCTQVMHGDYLVKAGYTEFKDNKYPFLVDTTIFAKHIEMTGEQFP